MKRLRHAAMALSLALLASAAAAGPTYSVVNLGPMPSAGMTLPGLNNAGQGVGTVYGGPWYATTAELVLFKDGQMQKFDPAGVLRAGGNAINDAGLIGGYLQTYDQNGYEVTHAAIFSGGTVTALRPAGEEYGTINGINNAGQVAGSMRLAGGSEHAFVYSVDAGYTHLTGLSATGDSMAYGINDSGVVVGRAQNMFGEWHAFSYANGVTTDLGADGYLSFAAAINNNGVAAGYSSFSPTDRYATHAALFKDGHVVDLGTLGGSWSSGIDINLRGDVIGASYRADNSYGFFLYHDGVMTDLDSLIDPGLKLQTASAINDQGQILGIANDGTNNFAVMLSPVPAPPAYMTLCAGLLALCLFRHRRRRN